MLQLISWWPLGMVLHQLQDETAPPGTEAARARLEKDLGEIENRYRNLPLKSCPPLEGLADWYFEWLDHPEDGPFWWPTDLATQFSEVDVPILHWNGWFDYRLEVTLKSFQGVRAQGRSEQCRKGQRLVIGPVKAALYSLSSARDTDWVVRLCDVWPDGRSMWVCDGILRARYRNSLERPELMVPGQIYRFEVDMWATAQVFPAGHRLRVQVTSSDFPWYDRNLNTGAPFGEEVRGQVAVNTVFHDTLRPSHVLLPVIP